MLPKLQAQSESYLATLTGVPEEEKIGRLKGKFTNSLARSIAHNFEMNHRIATNMERASWFIAASIVSVLVALLWGLGRWLLGCFF